MVKPTRWLPTRSAVHRYTLMPAIYISNTVVRFSSYCMYTTIFSAQTYSTLIGITAKTLAREQTIRSELILYKWDNRKILQGNLTSIGFSKTTSSYTFNQNASPVPQTPLQPLGQSDVESIVMSCVIQWLQTEVVFHGHH